MRVSSKLKVFAVLTLSYSLIAAWLIKRNWDQLGAAREFSGQLGPNNGDVLVGTIYILFVVVAGFTLFKLDKKREDRGNIGLRYHGVASAITTLTAVTAWLFLTYFGWRYVVWVVLLAWGSFGLNWYMTRHKTKGIDKQEAFK
jgi:hypothetical protein